MLCRCSNNVNHISLNRDVLTTESCYTYCRLIIINFKSAVQTYYSFLYKTTKNKRIYTAVLYTVAVSAH